MRGDEKMVPKTWEILYKLHHLAGLIALVFVVAVLYLTQDIRYWNVIRNQLVSSMREEQSTAYNDSRPRCDFFSGRWIYDNISHPLYKEGQCSFMEESFACERYGRKDLKYQHWRWQPHHCDIPRFNGTALLEKLRGKKLVFVGDSLSRNQWISMLCLIESSLSPSTNKTFTLTGNLYFFQDTEYNATIGFYWSPFLVESNCDDPLHHRLGRRAVRIQAIENHARHWNDADILVFDSYVWWLNPKMTILWGSFGSSDAVYKTVEMKLRRYEMALNTWSDWLEININQTKTKLFFMSVSPYTFKHTSRQCYNTSEPIFEDGSIWSMTNNSMMGIAESAIKKLEIRGVKVEYLRITKMSECRMDAHPSIYRKFYFPITEENRRDPTSYSDCLHWCLPGVPDTWNEILSAYIINS